MGCLCWRARGTKRLVLLLAIGCAPVGPVTPPATPPPGSAYGWTGVHEVDGWPEALIEADPQGRIWLLLDGMGEVAIETVFDTGPGTPMSGTGLTFTGVADAPEGHTRGR